MICKCRFSFCPILGWQLIASHDLESGEEVLSYSSAAERDVITCFRRSALTWAWGTSNCILQYRYPCKERSPCKMDAGPSRHHAGCHGVKEFSYQFASRQDLANMIPHESMHIACWQIPRNHSDVDYSMRRHEHVWNVVCDISCSEVNAEACRCMRGV